MNKVKKRNKEDYERPLVLILVFSRRIVAHRHKNQ